MSNNEDCDSVRKKGGVSIKHTCAYEGGKGGQILAVLELTC